MKRSKSASLQGHHYEIPPRKRSENNNIISNRLPSSPVKDEMIYHITQTGPLTGLVNLQRLLDMAEVNVVSSVICHHSTELQSLISPDVTSPGP